MKRRMRVASSLAPFGLMAEGMRWPGLPGMPGRRGVEPSQGSSVVRVSLAHERVRRTEIAAIRHTCGAEPVFSFTKKNLRLQTGVRCACSRLRVELKSFARWGFEEGTRARSGGHWGATS